ncbi:MAG: hypothetical protein DRP60_08585 [Spirochaetes bacterium]|nr:MAG: hypothetical protein DRP60_08585 [Spirochaetota bacterium]
MEIKSRYRFIVIATISVLFITFLGFWIHFRITPETAVEIRPIPVSAVRPELHDLRNEITLTGVLEAERMVTVVPKVSGTILGISFDEGDEVTEGDILARIDSEPYLLELKAAESVWLLADSSLSRLNRIKDSSGVSLQQLDEAKASRDAAYSRYELAKMKFGYAEIKAPVSGLLLKRFSDSGNSASPEYPLFLIGDNGNPRVKVHVPEKYWENFTRPESIKALVSYPAGGDERIREFKIIRISSSISPDDKTFEVICSIDAKDNPWPIGAGMRVIFVLAEKSNIWSLPLRALSADGNLWQINPDNQKVIRIHLNDVFRDKERFSIPEGMSGGLYVLDGQNLLQDGQLVTVFEAGA